MLSEQERLRWLAKQSAISERVNRAWAEEGTRLAAHRTAEAAQPSTSQEVDWAEVLLWSNAIPSDEDDVFLWAQGIAEAYERWQASRGPSVGGDQHNSDAHAKPLTQPGPLQAAE